jgi:NAD(P)-dependent dehydrogenase (short-subunit alcohol dehydrogenase family)
LRIAIGSPTARAISGCRNVAASAASRILRDRRRHLWNPRCKVVELLATGRITTSNFDKTFGINARGLLFTVQKALPLIRDGGSIILISSIAAFKGLPAHGIGLLYLAIGIALTSAVIGIALLFWWFVWSLVRNVKGVLALNQ